MRPNVKPRTKPEKGPLAFTCSLLKNVIRLKIFASNNNNNPNNKIIMPEIFSIYRMLPVSNEPNNDDITPIKIKVIDMPMTINNGRSLWSSSVPATMIGITGSTHGDATLKKPALSAEAIVAIEKSIYNLFISSRILSADWMPGVNLFVMLLSLSNKINEGNALMPY